MIGITITAEAYAAIKATLPADTQTWPHRPADQGDVIIWLDQATVDRLAAMRGPGESYSDAIIRIARGLVRLAAPYLIMAALFGAQIIAKEISRGRALAD